MLLRLAAAVNQPLTEREQLQQAPSQRQELQRQRLNESRHPVRKGVHQQLGKC